MAFKTSNLEELIAPLRIQIGDTATTPSFSDEYLHEVLRHAVNALGPRWAYRYYIDNGGVAFRNTDSYSFTFSSPPVIQRQDHRAIVLMASIMIKGGRKFNTSSSVVSWKDDEISYSNLESARQISSSIKDDTDELNMILPKRLARTVSGRLYGWAKDWE